MAMICTLPAVSVFIICALTLSNSNAVSWDSFPKWRNSNSICKPNLFEAEKTLRTDFVFDALVVQRSRAYVKESQRRYNHTSQVLFPERDAPKIVAYNLKSTYGKLLNSVAKAFSKDKPLFVLSIYYPLAYWRGNKDDSAYRSFDEGRQKQVVMLIRTFFLNRFESSAKAFEGSCWRLLHTPARLGHGPC